MKGKTKKPSALFIKAGMRFLTLCALILMSFQAQAIVPTVEQPVAVLRALDKITARVQEITVPINQPLAFGTLTITVRACRETPPEETPESTAFIEVRENKSDADDQPVFQGWMFASSPALSPFEHPVYDLWLTGCNSNKHLNLSTSSLTVIASPP